MPEAGQHIFVSCDIVAHSTESHKVQLKRVVSINKLVDQFIAERPQSRIVWASGGDGGHVAFQREDGPEHPVALIIALRNWAAEEKAPLRISVCSGAVNVVSGVNSQPQLVGPGINLAGDLVSFSGPARVVATKAAGEFLKGTKNSPVELHDLHQIQPKNSRQPIEAGLLSIGTIRSTWIDRWESSDKVQLQTASDALEIIYRAKRLLEVNAQDEYALKTLRNLPSRNLPRRFSNRAKLAEDMIFDSHFGPKLLQLGDLIERNAGEIICEFGTKGDAMFLILRGFVAGFRCSANEIQNVPTPHFFMQPGELAGELGFRLELPRTATLVALQRVSLLALGSYDAIVKTVDKNRREHLKGLIDSHTTLRLLENMWNTAPFFASLRGSVAVENAESPWFELAAESRLHEVNARRSSRSISTADWDDQKQPCICFLVSGRLVEKDTQRMFDGEIYPLIHSRLPKYGLSDPHKEYALDTDKAFVLTLSERGLRSVVADEGVRATADLIRGHPVAKRRVKLPGKQWDVFVSHASEDTSEFARPLAERLRDQGLQVWFDGFMLRVGDSLRRSIDKGLSQSRFGIVVISPAFLRKEWPRKELDALVALEHGGRRAILPVWHEVSREVVENYSPILADRLAANSRDGIDEVVKALVEAIESAA